MNKIKLNPRDLKRMNFFFSLIIFISFVHLVNNTMDTIYDKYFIEHSVVEGTVSSFTTDSVLVDINWLVEYEHTKTFTETDIIDMNIYINKTMKNDLVFLLSKMSHQDYLIIKKDKRILKGSRSKVIIFN